MRRPKKEGPKAPPDAWRKRYTGSRQLAWRRRKAGICRSSSSRGGLARSVTSRLIEACAAAGRAAGLAATGTTFSGAAGRATDGSTGPAAAGALGVAKAPVMRWNRLGERLSPPTGRATAGLAIGSLARTGARVAGRVTRQSVSSTNGFGGAGAGVGVGAIAAAIGAGAATV